MKRNLICRTCQRVMRWLLRFAPARFQEWGDAMMAETEVMKGPLQSLRWSVGCIGIILRQAIWNVCLGAGCGVWFWITAKEEDIGMRKARMIAVAALLVALVFFFAPSFRQAMSIAFDTLDDAPWANEGSGESALAQARITAERQHDARMLAYVAVHEGQLKLAQEAADQAVAIDPQWTWVYYVLTCRDLRWDHQPSPQSAVWIEKLRQWDPQNAETYFLESERLAHTERLGPRQLAENPQWVQIMARGFDSPRYDAYFQQGFDLDRDIAGIRGSANPLRFAVSVIAHPIPNLIGIREYEKSILRRAQDPSDLAQQAKRAAAFGERMMAADTIIEEVVGEEIALDGYQKLQPLVPQQDQALIAARIAQLPRSHANPRSHHPYLSEGNLEALIANAVVVQVCFVVIVAAAITMTVSAVVLIFRIQGSHKINLVFYGAARAMLLACVAAFIAYLPYSHMAAQVMNPRTSFKEGLPLLYSFFSFAIAPRQVLYGLPARVLAWQVVLIALSLLALWLTVRQFRKINSLSPEAK